MGVHKRGKYWYASFMIDGKSYLRSTKTTNKTAALAFERKWRNEIHAKEYLGDLEDISLWDAMDVFARAKQGTKNHGGLLSLIRGLREYFEEGFLIHKLTTAEVERYVQHRKDEGRKTQTILHGLHILRGSVQQARKLGYRTSEIEWPKLKKDKGRLRYLSAEEEQRLLQELQPGRAYGPDAQNDPNNWSEEKQRARRDNYHFVLMLLDTGARYGEVAGLEWSQVDLADRAIHLWRSKVSNESVLYMTDRVYAVLKERSEGKGKDKWVFTNKRGTGPRNHSTIAIRKAMQRAGLEGVRLHDLRHTAASKLVQNGLSLLEVSKILGHSQVSMTERYSHLEPTETSKKARDILNKLNQSTKPDLKVVG